MTDKNIAKTEKCELCKKRFKVKDELSMGVCPKCELVLGPHLAKAIVDPFDYSFGLKNGMVIGLCGESPTIKGDWIIFPNPSEDYSVGLPFPFERGLQVRLSEIAWVADAPKGS